MNGTGVYQIRNIINDHIYVGSSIELGARASKHRSYLRSDCHHNQYLQRAWNKYGEDAFIFETVITCTPSMCIWYEQQVIDQWVPEYNICKTAGSRLGRNHTEETRAKISKANLGNKNARSKLSDPDIYEIRRLYTTGKITHELLGKMFKVCKRTIGNIINYESRRDLQ